MNPCEVVGQIPVVVDKILFDPLLYMSISHEIREWSVCRPALHNESCRVSRELAAPLYTLNWLSFRTKPGLLRRLGDEEKADSWNLGGIG